MRKENIQMFSFYEVSLCSPRFDLWANMQVNIIFVSSNMTNEIPFHP